MSAAARPPLTYARLAELFAHQDRDRTLANAMPQPVDAALLVDALQSPPDTPTEAATAEDA